MITPIFTHIGRLHLLVNMYSLFMLGPYVERLRGSAKFVCFRVLTGLAGVGRHPPGTLGRFSFRSGDDPSAGRRVRSSG